MLTLIDNIHILPMNMHGMSERNIVLPYDPHSFIAPEVVNIPLWIIRVARVSIVSQIQDREVVIRSEGLAINFIMRVASLIHILSDFEADCYIGRIERQRIVWFRLCQGFIAAIDESWRQEVRVWKRFGSRIGVYAIVVDCG